MKMTLTVSTLSGQNIDGSADVFRIMEREDGTAVLRTNWHGNELMEFRSMGRLLLTLGGMIRWERWTEESRAALAELNGGGAI